MPPSADAPPAGSGEHPAAEPMAHEEALVDGLLVALAADAPDVDAIRASFEVMHEEATHDGKVSELAFAYEWVTAGKRLRAVPADAAAEFLYQAGRFFGENLGDELASISYLERAIAVKPAHEEAFTTLAGVLVSAGDKRKLAELYMHAALHRTSEEDRLSMLRDAAAMFDELPGADERALEVYAEIVRLRPDDTSAREALEAKLIRANRLRDVAKLLEGALETEMADDDAIATRVRLIDLYAQQLHEPDKILPHLEEVLGAYPAHEEAQKVAQKLLGIKHLAVKAAALLARSAEALGAPEDHEKFLTIELEHTRGPRRFDLLDKLAEVRESLGDGEGAYELLEQAVTHDPARPEPRQRFLALATQLERPLDAARTLVRAEAAADNETKMQIFAEAGTLFREGGDLKRARMAFSAVLVEAHINPEATRIAARALVGLHAADEDWEALADALAVVGSVEPEADARHQALEELAELAETTLQDVPRAAAAWRALLTDASEEDIANEPASLSRRKRARGALIEMYNMLGDGLSLAQMLEEQAAETDDPALGRELAYRAAMTLTTATADTARASASWRSVVETYGPSREAHAYWLPLLERERDWPTYVATIASEADLAPDEERIAILTELAKVQLSLARDGAAAIATFARMLAIDPDAKDARASLEKLSAAGEHRLDAARALQAVYRADFQRDPTAHARFALVRVLDVVATLSPDRETRIRALEEATRTCEDSPPYQARALEFAARAIAERLEADEAPGDALTLFERVGQHADAKRRGTLLLRALGDGRIETPQRFRIAVQAGDELAEGGDSLAAIEVYRRALDFDATFGDLLGKIDHLYAEQGNPEERIAVLKAALERGVKPARKRGILHALGALEVQVGRTSEAIAAYRGALELQPDDRDACSALVALYERTDDVAALCDLLEAQAELRPDDEARAIRAHLAEVAAGEGEPARARTQCERLLDDPGTLADEIDAVDRVARVLDDVELAERVLVRRADAATDAETEARWLAELGTLLHERKADRGGAATAWKRAAALVEEAGDDAAARALYSQARAASPDDRETLTALAESYERSGLHAEHAGALEALLQRVAAEHAENPEIADESEPLPLWIRLVQAREAAGDPEAAFAAAARAFAAMPKEKTILAAFERAALSPASEGGNAVRFAEALDVQMDKYASERPATAGTQAAANNPQVLILLGAKARVLAAHPATLDDAAYAYRALLAVSAKNDAVRRTALLAFEKLLAGAPASTEDTSTADHRRWLFAWRAEPGHVSDDDRARALAEWASLEEAAGDGAKAEEITRRLVALDPDSADALARLARLAMARGDVEAGARALFLRRDRLEGAPRRELDLEIARLFLDRNERLDEALACLAEVMDATPDDEGALALSSRLLSTPAGHDGAALLLERALDEADSPEIERNILLRLLAEPGGSPDRRTTWYERLLDGAAMKADAEAAYDAVLRACSELPENPRMWDRAETLSRELSRPEPLIQMYEGALGSSLEKSVALEIGERAVAFSEEWSEEPAQAVPILQKILDIDPTCRWAFDRLKLLYDAAERWDELFSLYDRAILATTDSPDKIGLLEDAAQIAKDFAGSSDRAIHYLEELLRLKPGNARLAVSLERLYERYGRWRELVNLLRDQLGSMADAAAQDTRVRIAKLLLDDLEDAPGALTAVEELIGNETVTGTGLGLSTTTVQVASVSLSASGSRATVSMMPPPMSNAPPPLSATQMLEKILEVAPKNAETLATAKRSMPPGVQRTYVRQRTAALLKARYAVEGRTSDRVRMMEIELETVTDVPDRVRRHSEIAGVYHELTRPEAALEHEVALVMLRPADGANLDALERTAKSVGRYERFAEVLVKASETAEPELRTSLLMRAADAYAGRLGDEATAIDLLFRVTRTRSGADAADLLSTGRKLEALLARAGRAEERLGVLEELPALEADGASRTHTFGEIAALATELGEIDRAVRAWEARLDADPVDRDALDGLVHLYETGRRWRPLLGALGRRASLPGDATMRRADRVRAARVLGTELGEAEEAIAAWRALETEFGASTETTEALASLLRGSRQWRALAELLETSADRAEGPAARARLLRELGDVWRENLGDSGHAITSYEAALLSDPTNDLARRGLERLATEPEHRRRVIGALVTANTAAGDWARVLDLTDARLETAKTDDDRVTLLVEASRIAEEKKNDVERAFGLLKRAFVHVPQRADIESELVRLAGKTGEWRALVDAKRSVLEAREGDSSEWLMALRFRMAAIIETELGDFDDALSNFARVAAAAPANAEAALATVRVGGAAGRWDAAARALVDASRAALATASFETVTALLAAYEHAADAAAAWTEATEAFAHAIERAKLTGTLARDLEARLAVWYRDRRDEHDAAEAAFTRALAHDPHDTILLGDLAALQRRGKGRPLVDSLLRLSTATGGDLELLKEAAEVSLGALADRALARTVLERLLSLSVERWLGDGSEDAATVTIGSSASPDAFAAYAVTELSRVHAEDDEPAKILEVLLSGALLPFPRAQSRRLQLEAAQVAEEKLGDLTQARLILEKLFTEDPTDVRPVERLTHLYKTSNDVGALLELRRRQIAAATDPASRLKFRMEAAQILAERGDSAAAIAQLREALEEAPHDPGAVGELSRVLERAEHWGELAQLLAEHAIAREEAGAKTEATNLWVRAAELALVQLNDADRALAHHRRAVALEERPGSLDVLARLSAARNEHATAAEYLERLLVAAPDADPSPVLLRLVDALEASNRTDAARARLESSLHLDPDAETLRARLVEMYKSTKDWALLATLLTEGADHAPDKRTRLGRLREAAAIRQKLGEPGAAIPLLEQAIDLDPDERGTKLELADALGAAGRFEESRKLLQAMVEGFGGRRPKERAPVHFGLARLDLAVGDRARALVELDAATRIDPTNPEILQAVAELAREDGQLDRAERSYRALLAVLRRSDDQEAPSVTRSEVLLALRSIALQQGDEERAGEILESALEVAEESDLEAKRLEAALRAQNDSATLVRALESRLVRLTRGRESSLDAHAHAQILGELAQVLDTGLERSEEALDLRLRALRLKPEDLDAFAAALVLARKLGQLDMLVEVATAAGEDAALSDAPMALTLAAELLLRVGEVVEKELVQLRDAAALYERAREVGPDPVPALRALDRVYEGLGDAESQALVLASRVAAETSAEGGAPVDALYRLAALELRSSSRADEGARLLASAIDRDADFDRAEEILRAAAERHPTVLEVLDLYEYVGRQPGRERALIDALTRRGNVNDADLAPWREASEVAIGMGDAKAAETLLARILVRTASGGADAATAAAWAHNTMSRLRLEAGDPRAAAEHKKHAAEAAAHVDREAARTYRFELAELAATALNDSQLAADTYHALSMEDPSDRKAWEPLLQLYRTMGEPEKLSELLGEVTPKVDDPAERARLRVERVHVMMKDLGLGDAAAPLLREIVEDDPGQAEAALLLAEILERQGKHDELIDLLSKQVAAAKDGGDATSVVSLSLRLGTLLSDRSDKAKEILYGALEWKGDDVAVLRALEVIHAAEWETADRADILERLIAAVPAAEAATLALELASIRIELEDEPGATRALELGYRADPTHGELHDRLEASYRQVGAWSELAQMYVVDAGARHDASEKVDRLRAAAAIYREQLNDLTNAADLLRKARDLAPHDNPLLGDLVIVLLAADEVDAAEEVLAAGIDSLGDDPVRAPLLSSRAEVRAMRGDDEGATADLELAVSLAAGSPESEALYRQALIVHLDDSAGRARDRGDHAAARTIRLRQAELTSLLGENEAARVLLAELLRDDSMDRDALRMSAHVEERAGRWEAVSAAYRRLVALEEGDAMVETAIKLAEACEKAGRPGDARGGLERARLARPDDVTLRQRLERVYEQAGAYRELAQLSLEDANASLDVGNRFKHLVRAGTLLVQSEDVEGAVAPLAEAHALRPADAECAARLVDALLYTGRGDDAAQLLDDAIAAQKGRRTRELAGLHHRRARLARMAGDRDLEIVWLSSALDIDTQNGAAASELAEVAMDAGQLDVASKALRAITLLKQPAPLPKALAYQYLGEIAQQQGDAKRAVLMFRRAVDEDPTLQSARALLDSYQ